MALNPALAARLNRSKKSTSHAEICAQFRHTITSLLEWIEIPYGFSKYPFQRELSMISEKISTDRGKPSSSPAFGAGDQKSFGKQRGELAHTL